MAKFHEKGEVDGTVLMFREIQLLCNLYNGIHQHQLIPGVMIITVLGASVSLFAMVSGSASMDVTTVLIFGNGFVNAIGTTFLCFYFAAKLFTESKELTIKHGCMEQGGELILAGEGVRQKRLLKRYWRSFPCLKIFFFERNFFECSTPLVILGFSMNFAINMILF